MENFNDFDLDITVGKKPEADADVQFTSKAYCTPGCITGIFVCITLKGVDNTR